MSAEVEQPTTTGERADDRHGRLPRSWRATWLTLGALVVLGAAVAALWYPRPPFGWSEHLVAALVGASAVLAGALRLLIWLRTTRGTPPDQAHASALLVLALGLAALVAGGGAVYTAVRQS